MSFLKRVLRLSGKGSKSDKSQAEKREAKEADRSSGSGSRSGTPSPTQSPKVPKAFNIRSQTNRHVSQVLPFLLLGSQEFAQDLHSLERHKVTHILNVTSEVDNAFPDKFTYKRISIPDLPSANISRHFEDSFAFINDARQNGCVLVHCYYGFSRSASIVMAFLIKTERMKFKEALEYLQLIREGVSPNDGFVKQLKQFELTVGIQDMQGRVH